MSKGLLLYKPWDRVETVVKSLVIDRGFTEYIKKSIFFVSCPRMWATVLWKYRIKGISFELKDL